MITESKISGTLAVTITAKVTVVAVIPEENKVILSTMGEQAILMEGEELAVSSHGLFNVSG